MRYSLSFCLLAASLSPAVAAPQERATRVEANNDPAHMICRASREIGSRLSSNRVCRTRAQWDEYRMQTRRSVERAQHESQSNFVEPRSARGPQH
jgi:hypothetical protein